LCLLLVGFTLLFHTVPAVQKRIVCAKIGANIMSNAVASANDSLFADSEG